MQVKDYNSSANQRIKSKFLKRILGFFLLIMLIGSLFCGQLFTTFDNSIIKYGDSVRITKGFYIGQEGIVVDKEGARFSVKIETQLKTSWIKKTILVTEKQMDIIK